MGLNEYILREIMKVESDNSISLFNTLNLLYNKAKVDLLSDEKHVLFFQTKISDILKSDLETEDIIFLRNGGWELSNDEKSLVKFLH